MSFDQLKSFESRAKLMVSGEYLVLKGALSLALPLKYGQKLTVSETDGNPVINWISMVDNRKWFRTRLLLPYLQVIETNLPMLSETLVKILLTAQKLNPAFLSLDKEYQVTSSMDFEPSWGIGSSSSLVSNISWWADCDPFELNRLIFNGSGYDIACARSISPIFFKLKEHIPSYREANFNPIFHSHLYFVYLNHKQNSRESLRNLDYSRMATQDIISISDLTSRIAEADSLEIFHSLIGFHEEIVGRILDRTPIKYLYFNDFNGSVKSLGAWGGDYILAATPAPEEYVRSYFNGKNLKTIFRYDEIVLK
jgi:hypothetical protein